MPGAVYAPRLLRRRGIHEEPLFIKMEDNSDTEVQFSPIPSTSAAAYREFIEGESMKQFFFKSFFFFRMKHVRISGVILSGCQML